MNTEIDRMAPTISLEDLNSMARSEPFSTFINYPFKEIRDTCIEGMKDYSNIGIGFADQAEAMISRLRLVDWKRDYWKKMLEWYLFAAEEENVLERAIEFALSLYAADYVLNDNLVSKLLTARLKKGWSGIEMYDKMPSLKAFFHRFLRNIYLDWHTSRLRSGEYSTSDWQLAMRTLDIAVLTNDYSLLWKIEETIILIEEGVIYPSKHSHWSAKEMNLALLKTAEKLLKKAKREAAAGEFD
jgi:hypothetical protein